ncbi:MAG: 2-iminobutanoate/2-iminopropanoate deaminase [Gaiellales bacterium]|jgi:2-iminobutanoate/2-iminopropanoate deaminase|nr:2-iminobutanoate/2-iminopropanoate deaminase [Gaiellales bacterium]
MQLRHVTVGAGSSMGGDDPTISDAVRFGDLVFLSGRAAVDPATLKIVGDDFAEQARVVLRDIEAVLVEAGSDWRHVLRIECFLADAADFAAWNRIWRERFAAPRPARTTVVTEFAVPGILIELQVTAGVVGVEP